MREAYKDFGTHQTHRHHDETRVQDRRESNTGCQQPQGPCTFTVLLMVLLIRLLGGAAHASKDT